jgi:hypothetical protein
MPKFLMFIEESKTTVRMKEFDAEDLEEAIGFVESNNWSESNGWEESDGSTNSEIRKDLCYQLSE